MSSESLRKALFAVAINKKSEKVQQKNSTASQFDAEGMGNNSSWLREYYISVKHTNEIGRATRAYFVCTKNINRMHWSRKGWYWNIWKNLATGRTFAANINDGSQMDDQHTEAW